MNLNGNGQRFQFIRTNELVALHGDGDLEWTINRIGRRLAAQHFAKAPDPHRWRTAGKRDQIFDASADLNRSRRQETDAPRTDVPGLLDTVNPLIAQLNYLQWEL